MYFIADYAELNLSKEAQTVFGLLLDSHLNTFIQKKNLPFDVPFTKDSLLYPLGNVSDEYKKQFEIGFGELLEKKVIKFSGPFGELDTTFMLAGQARKILRQTDELTTSLFRKIAARFQEANLTSMQAQAAVAGYGFKFDTKLQPFKKGKLGTRVVLCDSKSEEHTFLDFPWDAKEGQAYSFEEIYVAQGTSASQLFANRFSVMANELNRTM